MNARTVRALATLSLGLLLLPAASFAKSPSSSSSHSSHTSTSSTSSSHTSTTSATHPINLSKSSPSVATSKASTINLSKSSTVAPKVVASPAAARPVTPQTTAPAANATMRVKATSVAPRTTVVSNANTGTWFGGHYEVFDRPGVNATRVYRSDSAFSTARWLMDHKAYRAHQVVNAGYELRTNGQVLDQGTPAFDRWIEHNR